MKTNKLLLTALFAASLVPALAASGAEILQSQCASCHALSKPGAATLERIATRNGPDLYYAGVKFNKEWLVTWLQNPTVIRPAGVMYSRAVKPGAPGTPDVIDPALVPAHLKLSAADATAAADALMSLRGDADLVEPGAFKQGAPGSMAALLFNKLRGCSSCHSGKPGSGGLSGPELYTAGERLQADYIVEYIRSPQKFDPHVWMPALGLKDADVQKLTGYLLALKQEGAK